MIDVPASWSLASTSGVYGDGSSDGYTAVSWAEGTGKGATITPNGGDTTKTLFFPNAGYRRGDNGAAVNYGSWGYFWSADQYPNNTSSVWQLIFHSGASSGLIYDAGKLYALPIRCVRS